MKKKLYRATYEFEAETEAEARMVAFRLEATSGFTLARLDEEYRSWCPVRLGEVPSDG